MDEATLDPPGTIGVIGAGPLGIEAALYARFLGYDVTLFEATHPAHSLTKDLGDAEDMAIPLSPDRCVSPLGRSALAAQTGSTVPKTSPTTVREWCEQIWMPLVETDLLAGRLVCPAEVRQIDLIESDADQGAEDEEDSEVPPDFRILTESGDSSVHECVIVASGADVIECSFPETSEYFFRLRGTGDDSEEQFWSGLKQIVSIFAMLGGRSDLDLYRPLRG